MMKRKEPPSDKSRPRKKLHVFLPYDMEVETLSRLPGKSLMKFLCVSKTWSSLIRSQRFVASYYAAKKPSRFVVALTNGVSGDPKRLFILSGEEEATSSSSSSSLVAAATSILPSMAFSLVTSNYDHNPSVMVHEVITLGRGGVVSRSRVTSPYYRPMTVGLSINGFMYYAASVPVPNEAETPPTPVFVCFDVRNERILSFITTPKEVLVWKVYTSLIEYKGKLAVLVPTNCLRTGSSFDRFDLWILEDVTKHEWSRQSFQLPLSLPFAFRRSQRMISQGTNKAGEIIFSPTNLQHRAQPFYVFYFNTDTKSTKSTRRVRIHGVADTEEFWSRHGLTGMCCVSFSPQHNDSIAFL
ncbi:hypothetical protein HID58_000185 [Brassica napus]|uniref:F-box domain-containing protein n=1 Tax=Brassica napus TaxID=3708 RepID=A0ABQ8EGM3_BRANA|nr:hypothetical protein HID58_000185 [Brassica napus]